jgi:hypothetical protein
MPTSWSLCSTRQSFSTTSQEESGLRPDVAEAMYMWHKDVKPLNWTIKNGLASYKKLAFWDRAVLFTEKSWLESPMWMDMFPIALLHRQWDSIPLLFSTRKLIHVGWWGFLS